MQLGLKQLPCHRTSVLLNVLFLFGFISDSPRLWHVIANQPPNSTGCDRLTSLHFSYRPDDDYTDWTTVNAALTQDTLILRSLIQGSYVLKMMATNNRGLEGESEPLTVGIGPNPILLAEKECKFCWINPICCILWFVPMASPTAYSSIKVSANIQNLDRWQP